jgi:hypothetical protein
VTSPLSASVPLRFDGPPVFEPGDPFAGKHVDLLRRQPIHQVVADSPDPQGRLDLSITAAAGSLLNHH